MSTTTTKAGGPALAAAGSDGLSVLTGAGWEAVPPIDPAEADGGGVVFDPVAERLEAEALAVIRAGMACRRPDATGCGLSRLEWFAVNGAGNDAMFVAAHDTADMSVIEAAGREARAGALRRVLARRSGAGARPDPGLTPAGLARFLMAASAVA